MVTKILDHLYLGDVHDARKFDGEIICTMQELLVTEPTKAYWIPIIRTSGKLNAVDYIVDQDVEVTALPHQLDLVSFMIEKNAKYKTDTLIHCMAGIERSPLAVVWYLHKKCDMKWDEAYDFVQEKRPEVSNRLQWLKLTYEDYQS